MCGVIGLVYEHARDDLGQVAAELLKTLEYRGYDSTGAAVQGDDLDVALAKGVGAPSVMVHELGITRMRGQWRDLDIGAWHGPALPTLHPAFLLRTPSAKAQAWKDMLALKARLAAT